VLSTALERSLPYSAEQLFDLAADIERYPQFLPWWKLATIRERTAEYCCVDNIVSLGPVELQFRSEARLSRPQRIDVSSDEAPFRRFRLEWMFEPQPHSCRVRLQVELELRSLLLQRLVAYTLRGFIREILLAFEARGRALYVDGAAHGQSGYG
jgi:coenzyme Q-binding protein COQ10